jgi:iron(II)-dependent oxidoreductase
MERLLEREPAVDWKARARAELLTAWERVDRVLAATPHEGAIAAALHLANVEDRWLVRAQGLPGACGAELDARIGRCECHVALPRAEAIAYVDCVRERVLEGLERMPEELGGFETTIARVVQHGARHLEALLARFDVDGVELSLPDAPHPEPEPPGEVFLPPGGFVMGSAEAWALEAERAPHFVQVEAFFLDRHPVTNQMFGEFVACGGYRDRALWTEAGWAAREAGGWLAPLGWQRQDGEWWRRRFSGLEPVPPHEPVQHVSAHEAEAYARWVHKRLPTEAEWEYAAAFGLNTLPWREEWAGPQRANVGLRFGGPASVTAFRKGQSALGLFGMLGDVWEWTASDAEPYPGSHPSGAAASLGECVEPGARILRGGSWATLSAAVRVTARGMAPPDQRWGFAGFRLARDAGWRDR